MTDRDPHDEWAVLMLPASDGLRPVMFAVRDARFGCRVLSDSLNPRDEPQHAVAPMGSGDRLVTEKLSEGFRVIHGHWSSSAVQLFASSLRYNDPDRLRGESMELALQAEKALGHGVIPVRPAPVIRPGRRPGA